MDMQQEVRNMTARFSQGTESHAYRFFGCHAAADGAYTFRVFAPAASAVFLCGDFNDWNTEDTPLEPIGDGVWECTVSGVQV